MPTVSSGNRVIQVQVEIATLDKLDEISKYTHVPRAVMIRMAIERFAAEASAGKIPLGFSVMSAAPGGVPVQAAPTFQMVQDPRVVQQPVQPGVLPPGVIPGSK